MSVLPPYLDPEEPLLEPEPMPEPLLEPAPEPAPAPPGCFGVLPLPAAAPLEPAPAPLAPAPLVPPPAALEPDLLKYASHSCLEILPLLSLSTSEKLGVLEAAAPEAPPDAPLPADGLALLPLALGVELAPEEAPPEDDGDELLLPLALGVELAPEDAPELLSEGLLSLAPALELDPDAPLAPEEVELCAIAALASANSAAAVAVPTTFNNIKEFLLGELGKLQRVAMQ
jgi:hypothetical protein